MRRLGMSILALSLALPATLARADEGGKWPPAFVAPAQTMAAQPPAGLGRPIAQTPTLVAAPAATPAAVLDRPRALTADPQIQPASYGGLLGNLAPVVRSQAPDAARPLPPGPPAEGHVVSRNWVRPAPESDPAAIPVPEPDPVPSPSACDCGGACGGACGRWSLWSLFSRRHTCTDESCGDGGCAGDAAPEGDCGCGCGLGLFPCGCEQFGPPDNRLYGSADYLLWWVKGSPLPPLVTAGSAGDAMPGAIGSPGTSILFGDKTYGTGARSGGRFLIGWWFTDDHLLGIEAGGFALGQDTTRFSATSFGTPLLFRPFIEASPNSRAGVPPGTPTVEQVAVPGLAGTVSSRLTSNVWGDEANLRTNLLSGPCFTLDMFAGYRGLGLTEALTINENLAVVAGPAAGGQIMLQDRFAVANYFNGGQVGFDAEIRRGRWSLDFKPRIAVGSTHQRVDISGSTTQTFFGVTQTFPNHGLLAQPSNVGRYSRDRFSFAPEVGLNLGYQLTDHWRAFVGYDFLYWSSVVRPGNQIDPVVNSNQVAAPIPGGPARPAFNFNGSDFWAQGLNFGLEFRY